MKKGKTISIIAILAAMLMLISCGYKNGPPEDGTPWPENLNGEFSSGYGSMYFDGDGESIVIDFSKELARALDCPAGRQEGTYVFLFDNKAWRYDKADELAISIGENTYYFANMFTETGEDRIVLYLSNFNDSEPIYFERV